MRILPLPIDSKISASADDAGATPDAAEAYRLKAADLVSEFQLSCSKTALDRLLILVESESELAAEEAGNLASVTSEQKETLERELARFLSVTDPGKPAGE